MPDMSELDAAIARIRGDLDAVGPDAVAVDTSTDALRTVLGAVERVRELHPPHRPPGSPIDVCEECDGRNWPCTTVATLAGE